MTRGTCQLLLTQSMTATYRHTYQRTSVWLCVCVTAASSLSRVLVDWWALSPPCTPGFTRTGLRRVNEWVGGGGTALGGYRGGGTLSAGGGDCMQLCSEFSESNKDKSFFLRVISRTPFQSVNESIVPSIIDSSKTCTGAPSDHVTPQTPAAKSASLAL